MKYKRTVYFSELQNKWISYYENKKGEIKIDKKFKTKQDAKEYYRKNATYTTKKEKDKYINIELKAKVQNEIKKIIKDVKKDITKVDTEKIKQLQQLSKSIGYKQDEVKLLLQSIEHKKTKLSRTGFISCTITYVFQNKTNKSVWLGKEGIAKLQEKLKKYTGEIDYIVLQSEHFGTIEQPTTRKEIEKNFTGLLANILNAYSISTSWLYEEALLLLHKAGTL